jgi:spermidine synthase
VSLERIDVVDISRDVLDLSSIVYPDPAQDPLRDPRVRVIAEDGRFHLQTTDRRYDLITAEPPPPRVSGVQNLYSREFFDLARKRLRPGGFVTYWLPIHELLANEAKSVVRGFRRTALERFELGRRLTFLLHRGPTYENVHAALTTPKLCGVSGVATNEGHAR